MSTIPPIDEPGTGLPDDELLAAEYALGVLDAAANRAAEARIRADAAFAGQVSDWEARLAPWLLRAEPVAPGAQVWPRIRTRLGWSPVAPATGGVWQSAAFWRGATALALAAGLAAVVLMRRPPAPQPPALPPPVVVQPPPSGGEAQARPVTVLAREDGSTGWIATVDPDGSKVHMVPVPTAADPGGRVDELWVIPDGGAPISLGFVSNEKAHSIAVPDAIRQAVAVGATLAVTLEPEAGIPHAAPSGPVVAKGSIASI